MINFRYPIKDLLLTPNQLFDEFPLSTEAEKTVTHTRNIIRRILKDAENKFLVIVGPCSIHDPDAALEYAYLLKEEALKYKDQLVLIMRVYLEKPRTTLGWKGLISDPFLNGSFNINAGLRIARKLLLDINNLGVPVATEFLDPLLAHFYYDLISWTAIGARTTASPLHRELASGLPMPVGFKNTMDGNVGIAIDAVKTAAASHHFVSINNEGRSIIVNTDGNHSCHIILRGSQDKPNFYPENVLSAIHLAKKSGINSKLMIDCSHGNSQKDYTRQSEVATHVTHQIKHRCSDIFGIMLESNLIAGKQEPNEKRFLRYGQSITDACLGWQETVPLLEKLAKAQTEINSFPLL